MGSKGWKHFPLRHYGFKKDFLCDFAPLRALRETKKLRMKKSFMNINVDNSNYFVHIKTSPLGDLGGFQFKINRRWFGVKIISARFYESMFGI